MNGGAIALGQARQRLFGPNGLDDAIILRALGDLAGGGADLADLFFETRRERSWRLENGKVASGGFASRSGVGARAAREGRVAFAHSADLRPAALAETARAVRTLRSAGDDARLPQGVALPVRGDAHALYKAQRVADNEDAAPWLALLRDIDGRARAADPRIVRVEAGLRAIDAVVLIADIERGLIADVRPAIHLWINVVAETGTRRTRGHAGLGGRFGLEGLSDAAISGAIARAVRIATVNLDAVPAPVGTMPVVLAPGYPGVLFHEAVGHGLEGDHHRKKLSAFTGRVGERIAAPGVDVIDDGGIPDRLGSLGIDDEGTPAQRTMLVEDGVLVGLLQDRLNAGLMNERSTGNGRRQSYAHLPMPRMTNTFLAGGSRDPVEILASVQDGIYAVEFGGGQVDIVSGRFNFTTTEAWRIEGGRLSHPISGATLIGVGHEALRGVSMIGSDLALDSGEAMCGKQGQQVDVGVGQPTIRIDGMMVGGQAQ
jgi:TldD protein